MPNRRRIPGGSFNQQNGSDDGSSSTEVGGRSMQSWFSEVAAVLERPFVSLSLFALGVLFIVIASKQVKLCFNIMEVLGVSAKPQDNILNNFMAVFVFFFVWVDIMLVTTLRKGGKLLATRVWNYAKKVRASMIEVANKENNNLMIKNKRNRQ